MSAPLGSADVGDRRWQARWRTVSSYFSAPCLHVSLATGGAGGAAIFAVRFLSSQQLPASLTWGAAVAGLLAGTNWAVCRRAMYVMLKEKSAAQPLGASGLSEEDAAALRAALGR